MPEIHVRSIRIKHFSRKKNNVIFYISDQIKVLRLPMRNRHVPLKCEVSWIDGESSLKRSDLMLGTSQRHFPKRQLLKSVLAAVLSPYIVLAPKLAPLARPNCSARPPHCSLRRLGRPNLSFGKLSLFKSPFGQCHWSNTFWENTIVSRYEMLMELLKRSEFFTGYIKQKMEVCIS